LSSLARELANVPTKSISSLPHPPPPDISALLTYLAEARLLIRTELTVKKCVLIHYLTHLPIFNDFDSVLIVVDHLARIANFVPCTKTVSR
jgi:hypothetical protein